MPIESDVYVKWGEDGKKESLIDGDSTDDAHWYWSELRSCGFSLERKNPGAGEGAGDSKKKKSGVGKPETVTFTKKVDWASPRLFEMCCVAKDVPEKGNAKLNKVRVEVCRTAGAEKFAFVVILYHNVRVLNYKINLGGPEPQESLTLQFDSFDYGFRPTDPFTGVPDQMPAEDNPDNGLQWAYSSDPATATGDGGGDGTGSSQQDAGSEDSDDGSAEEEDEQGSAAESGAAAAAALAGVTAASAAVGAGSGNGSLNTLISDHDSTVRSTFPGLWDDNGFGLLPDNP